MRIVLDENFLQGYPLGQGTCIDMVYFIDLCFTFKVGGDIHVPSESLAHCQRRQYFKGKWLQFSATLLKPIDDEPTDYRKGKMRNFC